MGDIKTFNSAKLYAEQVLHPLIKNHSESKITTRLGAISIAEANNLSTNQRIVNRYNAGKERVILLQTLVNEIEATVRINNVKAEINMLTAIKKELDNVELNFENRKDDIIENQTIRGVRTPTLTILFSKINIYLDSTYVQIQKIMTKNKLLFTSENDDWLQDSELKEKIKSDNIKS